ncbi:MAG TPA: bifunctional molybdenum cofactor biosynthesis protein MoaC/MoaB [Rhodanobacter sp.]|jgi:molybdenum cofactor biosynthesis protein MoaC|nr:bifunctional molybdenum cofactor biosynthesis protein MoaC/MoaB [Rhodanobacter sp.]
MKDITSKPETLRSATAQAVLEAAPEYIELLEKRLTDKGDALEAARFAGTMAAKRTWELIPLCHQIAMSVVTIDYEFAVSRVTVIAHVQAIAATGAEMEAITAASVAAITLYDMLKPHAGTDIVIGDVKLIEKSGGKSQYLRHLSRPRKASVVLLSDSVSAGTQHDVSGVRACERLLAAGFEVTGPILLPDEPVRLQQVMREQCEHADLVLTVGGTGISPRDTTVDAIEGMLDRHLPGMAETARAFGQRRTPFAMLSRAVAGTIADTLVITVPGSVHGVEEYLDALLPGIIHALGIMHGEKHQHGYRDVDA